jgi:hypothetical protein
MPYLAQSCAKLLQHLAACIASCLSRVFAFADASHALWRRAGMTEMVDLLRNLNNTLVNKTQNSN